MNKKGIEYLRNQKRPDAIGNRPSAPIGECQVWVADPKQRDPHQRCANCGRPRDRHDLALRDDGSLITNVERRA